ncbi:MAG: DUF1501 domain-containing protein [Gemmataceae bacterium]
MTHGCQGYRMSRRDVLRAGGAGLFGLTFPQFFQARAAAAARGKSTKAKQMILLWLAGGPPHQDMFDMKPDTPPPYGSELKPARTKVPGIDICSLMPRLAQNTDKFSILRSVGIGTEKWEHSGGLYWLSGNPRTKDSLKHPMIGSVVAKEHRPVQGLPTYVSFGPYKESGDLHVNFLGPAHDPLMFKPGDAKDEVGSMLVPPPQLDAPALARREDLLKILDAQLRQLDAAEGLIGGLDQFQQSAFDLLRSPRLRDAIDPKKLEAKDIERYGKNEHGCNMLTARRLVEAGVPFVFVPWNGWDYHGSVTKSCEKNLPILDALLASLFEDLHERGLLESTIVTVLGEMGRNKIWKDPGYSGPPGRDHWGTTQFVLVAGGGFKNGMVLGATDKTSLQVTDKYYSPISFGRTLYHLLGIDPDKELYTTSGRPVKIIVDEAPLIRDVLA